MCRETSADLTALLRRAGDGDGDAAGRAYEALYCDLQRIARRLMRSQPSHHTLDAEALIHEAFLKVSASGKCDWNSRGHFLAVMSRAMRHRLIDHAKRKLRLKHGGDRGRVPLTGILLRFEDLTVDLLALHEAIDALRELDSDAVRALEARYFAGLTSAEVAEAVGRPLRSVERDLQFARTWIRGELSR